MLADTGERTVKDGASTGENQRPAACRRAEGRRRIRQRFVAHDLAALLEEGEGGLRASSYRHQRVSERIRALASLLEAPAGFGRDPISDTYVGSLPSRHRKDESC